MFAHMSYDDDDTHLVFKYNEEYENDLEIHKSTTIQSLYSKQLAKDAGTSVKQAMAIEMANLGLSNLIKIEVNSNDDVDGNEFDENRESKLYTDPDKSGFVSGTQNLLIRESQAVEMSNKAQEEVKEEEEPPFLRPASSNHDGMI